MSQKVLLNSIQLHITIKRLALQLLENHLDFKNCVLIGLQSNGVCLADRIKSVLEQDFQVNDLQLGYLDITFYRDDFRRRDKTLTASKTQIDFLVEGKKVVLIDDVLHTGRSVRAALTAIQHYGRPESIELLVLIDRRFSRDLPIQPDYLGKQVDAITEQKVKVVWSDQTELYQQNHVYLMEE